MPQRRTGDLQAQRPDEELWADVHRRPLGVEPLVWVDTAAPLDAATLAAIVRRVRDEAAHPTIRGDR